MAGCCGQVFYKVNYSVQKRGGKKGDMMQLTKNVSGQLLDGHLTAIMGPSGTRQRLTGLTPPTVHESPDSLKQPWHIIHTGLCAHVVYRHQFYTASTAVGHDLASLTV